MNTVLLVLLMSVFSLLGFGFIVYFFTNQIKELKLSLEKPQDNPVLMEWMKEMKASVDKSSDKIDNQLKDQRESLERQTKLIWERLENSQKVIQDVSKQLGGIEEFGKDMKDLSNVLKSPKLRGGLGEQLLYEILADNMPAEMFKTQYKFRDGNICDAVVFTEKGIIPIDSKFSMENYKAMMNAENDNDREKFRKEFFKDVKKRIDEISSKYIKPDENTTNQAVMYIPSESIYYEVITRGGVEEYLRQKNVMIASPGTLLYLIRIVLVAHKQMELQKHAGEILKALSGIQVDAEKFSEELDVLDGHINRASKSMDTVKNKFTKFSSKLEAVAHLKELPSAKETNLLPSDQ